MEPFVRAIVLLVIVGVVMYLIESEYIPLPVPFRIVIRVIAVLGVCLYLLRIFGIL